MNRIRDHLDLSKFVTKCKNCKNLMLIKYLDNVLCEKCDKQYQNMLHKFLYNS